MATQFGFTTAALQSCSLRDLLLPFDPFMEGYLHTGHRAG